MSIPVPAGLVLHLETDNGLVSSGNTVTRWNDASGLGLDVTALGDPLIGSVVTPSGAPAIELDGVGDALERSLDLTGLPSGNSDRTVFFVVDYDATQGIDAGFVYGDAQSDQAFGLIADDPTDNLGVQAFGPGDRNTGTNGVAGSFLVQSAVFSAGELRQYSNGTLIGTDTTAFNTTLAQLTIGESIAGGSFADLNVSAVIVYDRALNETERQNVETYLQNKYLVDDGLNNAPVAVGEDANLNVGQTVQVDILANEQDEGPLDGSSITIVQGPSYGTIDAIDPTTGELTYTNTDSTAVVNPDTIIYTVTDGNGAVSEEATLTLNVQQPALSLEGFFDEPVVTRAELNTNSPFFLPISMAFLPDNRMLLLSKDGEIVILDPESGNSSTLMTLSNVNSAEERGLLDITLDPDFANNGYFYLYYTPQAPQNARISRFTFEENAGGLTATADLSSEMVIWTDTDGYLACCHFGGGLDFGPDGKLWLTSSDKFQVSTPGEGNGADIPLDLTSSSGKIIRVNPDGSVPDGTDGQPANPYADPNDGFNDYIWAYGLRNPFRAEWDFEYGNLYIAEVGGNQQLLATEDLHISSLDQPGAFYGWPFYEGENNTYVNGGLSTYDPNDFPTPDGDPANAAEGDFFSAPIWALEHNGRSASLTGGEVYRGDLFPTEWDGVYFYGDYTQDYIRYLVLDNTGTQVLGDFEFKPSAELLGDTNEVVSINVGADGALYYAMIASGDVRRINYTDGSANRAPEIVSASLSPVQGIAPFVSTLNATVTDPDGDALTYSINFGDGTVVSGTVGVDGLISETHNYTTFGVYPVSLSVSDAEKTVYSLPFSVNTNEANEFPVITGEGSDVAVADPGVTLVNFSATATDSDGDPLTYTWFFGDGNTVAGSVDPSGIVTASHTYLFNGAFSARLEVSDGIETVASSDVVVQVGDVSAGNGVPVTSGLVLLLQSDIKIGLTNGNEVAAWLDGSGNGNNLFAQGNPTLVNAATPTGESAIVFDGDGDILERVNVTDQIFNLPTGSADRTMFFVVNYLDSERQTSGVIYGEASENEAFGLASKAKQDDLMIQGWGKVNDHDSNVDAIPQGWMVQSVVLENDVFDHYLNGGLIDTDSHTFNTDLQRLVIGGEIDGTGESQLEVAAVLVYDRALNATERQDVETFLQDKYILGEPPVAQADTVTTAEDTALIGGDVLADNGNGIDSDPDGDPLSVSLITDVTNGTLVLNTDGTFDYTPDLNFNGQDSFVYELSDGNGGTAQATVTIDVTPVNDPSVAVADSYITDQGVVLNVDAQSGVVANDIDVDGDVITASLITDVTNGTLVLNADGSFGYTPNGGFVGQDSFVYAVPGGAQATVTLTVIDPTAVPVAQDDTVTTAEDTALIAGDVLADNGNGIDSDPDGDPLDVSLITDVTNGTLALNTDGTFDYTPDLNFNGQDSFVYEIADGNGGTDQATVTINVTSVDDPAVAVADSYQTEIGAPLSVAVGTGVLANDTDIDGGPLAASLVTDVSNGTLVLNADGSFDYTPNALFTGLDSFTYAVTGGDQATVTIDVSEPGVPVTTGLVASYASDENVSVTAGNQVSGWLDGSGRGNDLLAQGDPTLVAGATPTGESAIVFDGDGDLLERVNATDTLNGLVGGSADRTMFFVVNYIDSERKTTGVIYGDGAPNEAFGLASRGKQDDLMIQGWGKANDHDSNVDAIPQGWMVQSVVLENDVFDHYLNGGLIDTDSHTFNTDLQRLVIGGEIDGTGESQLEVAAVLVYDRALNATERQDVETFLQDKYILGEPPVAQADTVTTAEDTALIGGDVLADNGNGIDSDPDGDPLSVSLITDVTNGTLVLNTDGTFDYTPDLNFNGQDSFVYELSDGNGGTAQATVTIDVTPVNDPSVAVADSYITDQGVVLNVDAQSGVVANDIDVDGDVITASLITDVTNGTLVLNADGSFGYTPNGGFVGQDSFVYAVPGGAQATVTLTVIDPTAVPVAQDDTVTTAEDTALIAGDVLADNGNGIDSDPDGDPLDVSLITDVTNGTLVLNTDGTFDYTPDLNFNGQDSFVYEIADGNGGTDQATVTINVTSVDDPAVAVADSYQTEIGAPLSVAVGTGVLANDTDIDGGPLAASLVTDVSNGTLVLNADGSFDYTPNALFTGLDSFTYAVTGGDQATVTIDVSEPGVPVTTGLVASYASDENVSVTAGNQVSGWLDGSGRGNDLLAQGDPTLVAGATPTGESAIVFDGDGDLLERVNATDTLNGLVGGSADRTMFFVVNYIDSERKTTGVIYGDGAPNEAFGLASRGKQDDLMIQGWGKANDHDSNVDAIPQGWMVQSVVLENDVFDHYLNGGLIDTDSHTFNTDLQSLVIGGEIDYTGEAQLEVAAALIYDRALNETERQDVETFLQQTYINDEFVFVWPGRPHVRRYTETVSAGGSPGGRNSGTGSRFAGASLGAGRSGPVEGDEKGPVRASFCARALEFSQSAGLAGPLVGGPGRHAGGAWGAITGRVGQKSRRCRAQMGYGGNAPGRGLGDFQAPWGLQCLRIPCAGTRYAGLSRGQGGCGQRCKDLPVLPLPDEYQSGHFHRDVPREGPG